MQRERKEWRRRREGESTKTNGEEEREEMWRRGKKG